MSLRVSFGRGDRNLAALVLAAHTGRSTIGADMRAEGILIRLTVRRCHRQSHREIAPQRSHILCQVVCCTGINASRRSTGESPSQKKKELDGNDACDLYLVDSPASVALNSHLARCAPLFLGQRVLHLRADTSTSDGTGGIEVTLAIFYLDPSRLIVSLCQGEERLCPKKRRALCRW